MRDWATSLCAVRVRCPVTAARIRRELRSHSSTMSTYFRQRWFMNYDWDIRGFTRCDFLLGLPRTANRNTGVPYTVTTDVSYNLFVQDSWKVSNKLTLEYGVRYEYNRPVRERKDQIASFDPASNSVRVAHCGKATIDA